MTNWEKNLEHFDKAAELCKDFDRKGKKMIYTSANGYMFSLLNADAEVGIRLDKTEAEKFKKKYESGAYYSHGAALRDYVIVPQSLLESPKEFSEYLKLSYKFVMSLKPK